MPEITETFYTADPQEWRAWLAKNWDTKSEIWLVLPKQSSGKPRISYNDSVEQALCFGWIDSIQKPFGDDSTVQRFTPRKVKGHYSQPNIERLRYLGGLPLSLDLTYLEPEIGARVLTHPLESNDIFALIEQLTGRCLGAASLALEAIPADAHSAAALQVPDGAPLLMLERLTSLDDGRPVDLEYIRMRGDRITLRGNLVRGI